MMNRENHFPVRALMALLLFLNIVLMYLPCKALELSCVVPESQYVNVRKQPRSDAATWGKLHNGDKIEVESIENGFIEFAFGSRTGYASVKYFEEAVSGEFIVTANGRVRTRNAPAGKRVGWVEPGTTVKITAWRYDDDGGKWGKCMGEFISADFLVASSESAQ